jgi:hypothetical protein
VKLAITRSSSDSVKASIQPDTMAGSDDRQRDLEEGLHRRRAEIHRGLFQRAVEVISRDCTTTATKHMVKVMCAKRHRPEAAVEPTATNSSSSDRPVMTSGMTSGARPCRKTGAAAEARVADQRQRRQRAEHGGEGGRHDADAERHPGGVHQPWSFGTASHTTWSRSRPTR